VSKAHYYNGVDFRSGSCMNEERKTLLGKPLSPLLEEKIINNPNGETMKPVHN
jgi:hypothetical protein